jgi:radical SAM superfamily enzyme YgiQ (UPF0313 family)
MNILLVNPRQSTSLFTFSEALDITGCPGYMPNIALPTLAALRPDGVHITLVDEAVEPIDYDRRWDVVGITGYITQRDEMVRIAAEFRRRGQLVAIGGPYASLSPSALRPYADVLFIGEAERTWPQFLMDFRAGRWDNEYRSVEPVDIASSPIPDISTLQNHAYLMGVVQTSRGCPFECEFCDVIIYLGRRQRHKPPDRVVQELEQLYHVGYRSVFLSDDNFTANRDRAAQIMQAVRRWNLAKPERVSFATQMSIDVARARDGSLLDLCAEAGLKQAFVGIETPDFSALQEVKKRQNLRPDLVGDIHAVQQRGIMVQAGVICGFDSDSVDSFRTQYEFLQRAGTAMVSVTMLNAPEGTPLEARLRRENRLKLTPVTDAYFDTNLVPKNLTDWQLRRGTQWLLNRLYQPDAFLERVAVMAHNLPAAGPLSRVSARAAAIWHKIPRAYQRLGPEFTSVPREAVRLCRGRDTTGLGTALIFYRSVVAVLRKSGLWDPRLARLSAPDLGSPATTCSSR